MSTRTKYVLASIVAAILVFWILPSPIDWLLVLALIAVPVVGYMMLDPSQRTRLKRVGRKRLGS
ncbi:MAG: hypothetical protein GEV11_05585 [Streptosporangiales bacterium]|nr:hypothetical protein [Streptosporangiales bacterium]